MDRQECANRVGKFLIVVSTTPMNSNWGLSKQALIGNGTNNVPKAKLEM
jgi:hypothetical protein